MRLLAPVSNTSRHTSSQKAHTFLVLLSAELLPWLSAALECHRQSRESLPHTPTHKPTPDLYLHRECHATRVFSVLLSHRTTQTLLTHKGLATASGERKERPHNTAELTTTEKRKVFSTPMQYGKQRHHQVTFKVCALRGKPTKPSAKHYHSAITLFPVINCRSHSKAGTSYFHNPGTLGMQHVSALLLSTLREAMQLQSSKLCPSGHPGAPSCSCYRCYRATVICRNLAHQFLELKFLGYHKTNSQYLSM